MAHLQMMFPIIILKPPFIMDYMDIFPIKTSIYNGLSIAMLFFPIKTSISNGLSIVK